MKCVTCLGFIYIYIYIYSAPVPPNIPEHEARWICVSDKKRDGQTERFGGCFKTDY